MIEKVLRLDIKRVDGFYYFLKDDGVYRVAVTVGEDGVMQPTEGAANESVKQCSWTLKEGYYYQLDNEGDIVRYRELPELRWSGERVLPSLEHDHSSERFNAKPNSFWLITVPEDDDVVDAMVITDEQRSWASEAAQSFREGDGVFLWAGPPFQCVVGLAEVVSRVTTDDEGDGSFEIRMLTNTFGRPFYKDDIVYDPVLGTLECFFQKQTDGDVALEDRSALRLLKYIAAINPVTVPITTAWTDALRARLGADEMVSLSALAEKDPVRPPPPIGDVTLTSGVEYRVLSVRPPWAWSIVFAGKDIENRSWSSPHRGPILIHASSKKYVGKALEEARQEIAECSGLELSKIPKQFPRSQIIGMVDVIDYIPNSRSRWAFKGEDHWVLHNPRRLQSPIKGVDGKLNLWKWTAP